AKRAMYFVRANAVLAIGNHPNGSKPLVQTERRVFKDSSDFDAKLSARVRALALPFILRGKERHVFAATGRTDNAIRPTARGQVVKAVLLIGEVNNRLLECFWRVLL